MSTSRADRKEAHKLWERLCQLQEEWATHVRRYHAGEIKEFPGNGYGYGDQAVNMIANALRRSRRSPGAKPKRARRGG